MTEFPAFPYVFRDDRTDALDRIPGATFVAVNFFCAACDRAGKRSRLAQFGRNTFPGAGDSRDWQKTWRRGDGWTGSPWVGIPPDDAAELVCGRCGHTAEVPRARILELLGNVTAAADGYGVDRRVV
jgi:hypothetical protein